MDPFVMGVETDALVYQVPGGMLSNLIAQLKAQNALDRWMKCWKKFQMSEKILAILLW